MAHSTFRIMKSSAVSTVITSSPFVTMKLTNVGWRCIGTGTEDQCKEMVARSKPRGNVTVVKTDVPDGLQVEYALES